MRRDEQNRLICNMYEVFRWVEVHSGLSGDSHLFRSASSGLWKLEMCCPLVDIFFLLRVKPGWVRKQMHPSGNKQTLVFAKPFRFERQQAILKEELAKITQREKELADEKTKASIQERQHARQESEKTKQLVWKKKDLELWLQKTHFWQFNIGKRDIFGGLLSLFKLIFWGFRVRTFPVHLWKTFSFLLLHHRNQTFFLLNAHSVYSLQNHKAHFLTLIRLCSIHYVIQL